MRGRRHEGARQGGRGHGQRRNQYEEEICREETRTWGEVPARTSGPGTSARRRSPLPHQHCRPEARAPAVTVGVNHRADACTTVYQYMNNTLALLYRYCDTEKLKKLKKLISSFVRRERLACVLLFKCLITAGILLLWLLRTPRSK